MLEFKESNVAIKDKTGKTVVDYLSAQCVTPYNSDLFRRILAQLSQHGIVLKESSWARLMSEEKLLEKPVSVVRERTSDRGWARSIVKSVLRRFEAPKIRRFYLSDFVSGITVDSDVSSESEESGDGGDSGEF